MKMKTQEFVILLSLIQCSLSYAMQPSTKDNSIFNTSQFEYEFALEEEMLEAAGSGNALKLMDLLEDHADVNYISNYSPLSALDLASLNGHFNAVSLLTRNMQTDVNYAIPLTRETALHFAVEKKHHRVAEILLGRDDLDVNAVTIENRTPLMMAVENGDLKMIQLLLTREDINIDFRSSVDSDDQEDQTDAIQIAKNLGHTEILDVLQKAKKRISFIQKRKLEMKKFL